jgi:NADH-quinone oxidoreductase subunit A
LVLATLFAGLSFLASTLLGPSKPTAAKTAPYECGIVPTVEPVQRFPVRFYLVAMIFIIFDIEIIFTYPWAVIYGDLHLYGLVEMLVFSVAVFVSFLYLLSNGALDWGPARSMRPVVVSDRTTASTVRRVAKPGTPGVGPDGPGHGPGHGPDHGPDHGPGHGPGHGHEGPQAA